MQEWKLYFYTLFDFWVKARKKFVVTERNNQLTLKDCQNGPLTLAKKYPK